MASAESVRIKVRSRRLISDIRKSSSSVKNSQPSEQKSTVTCLNNIHERPLNLAADIVEQMNSRSFASVTESSTSIPCASLSSCYRPIESRHFDEFSRRRRRTVQLPTVTSCYRKPLIRSDTKTVTLESSRVVSTPSQTPDRISRLAGRVESLELHDVHTGQHVPTGSSSSTVVNMMMHNSQQLSKSIKQCVDDGNPSSPSEPPWYRHCRPSAPKPYCTPTCSRSDDSSTETLPNRDSASDQFSTEPKEERDVKITRPFNNNSSHPPAKLDLPALELDVDQENRCMELDFPLPPVPIPAYSEPYSEDMRWPDDLFPSPPPQLTNPAIDTWSHSTDPLSTTIATSLGPLAPITNILPNPVISGARQPKWLTASQARHRINGLQQTLLFNGQLDSSSRVSSLPSPPPVIIERIPDLPALRLLNTPEDDDSHHLLDHTLPLTNLARPTVLKRGPPDGAEQDTSSKSFELETKKLDNDADAKRLFTPFGSGSYSPKKSRTQLLVPSEHSAFLPVGSNPALCRRVSSPCVH